MAGSTVLVTNATWLKGEGWTRTEGQLRRSGPPNNRKTHQVEFAKSPVSQARYVDLPSKYCHTPERLEGSDVEQPMYEFRSMLDQ